ncbi:MAG: hypothetical protein DI536_33160 [Archangium gephyra]|uniref:DUF7793 domain-containing protein n=1 Tax=Archangium gephyra TaxID=48 RepID=A0A2W5SPD7_9BACT|nr:MAG: hypothetical protein DI536_33160 [Archangium gephyra]
MTPDPSKWKHIGTSSNAKFYEADEDVLVVMPDEGSTDTATSADESIRIQVEYLREHNRRAGTVVMMDGLAGQDVGARAVYRDKPDPSHQVCFALVGGTTFGRTAGSIFTSLAPPRCPTRLFTDFDEAVAWVKTMVRAR